MADGASATGPVATAFGSTGMTGETMVEITAGLDAGQTIVTGPFKTLREIEDGDKARLEEPKKDAKKAKKG